uniref:Uncharacterized protein n=1 Tax=Acrobeloides nanus TaxID=290746 RepID=A0A914C560_9BILA
MAAIILKKVFTLIQWGALLICLAGVICVNSSKFDGSSGYFDPENMDQLIGIGLVLAMCWMSAFAGVYLEKVLKDSPDDLWLQNIRLSSVTLLITIGYISQRYITVENYDFFQGWNYWNWIVSLATAIGGLITAAVLKYADNVRKSLCQSLAICGTAFLSIALGDSLFTIGLLIGTVLVIISIFVYTFGGKKPEPKEKVVEDVEKNSNSSPDDKEISKNSLSLENPKEAETEPMLKEVEVVKNVQEGA